MINTAKRVPLYGVGINDAPYEVVTRTGHGFNRCPFYVIWASVMARCYSPVEKRKNPTYQECTSTDEWMKFSNFKLWMESQDWQGNALDKDIIVPGNTIYGPEFCCFVPQWINNLVTYHKTPPNGLPRGVAFHKAARKYQAGFAIKGKRQHLGLFFTVEDASKAYNKAKAEYIRKVADELDDSRVRQGLHSHAALLESGKLS